LTRGLGRPRVKKGKGKIREQMRGKKSTGRGHAKMEMGAMGPRLESRQPSKWRREKKPAGKRPDQRPTDSGRGPTKEFPSQAWWKDQRGQRNKQGQVSTGGKKKKEAKTQTKKRRGVWGANEEDTQRVQETRSSENEIIIADCLGGPGRRNLAKYQGF